MNIHFHELLLSELHMAVFRPGDPAGLTDELLCIAVTLNENLRALGYTLRPEDLVRLAVSPSLPGFYAHMEALVPQVKALPMYPGFPRQAMEMPEAVFRLHQALHYFSTYGLEALTGASVSRGWLPDYEGPERTRSDTRLLDAHVLTLAEEDEAPMAALKRILERREKLTMPELALVELALPACDAEQLAGLTIRFKENLDLIFPLLVTMSDRKAALSALHSVCAHAGDALRCSEAWLAQRRWHLRTAEKKLLVKLLESYGTRNLQENLMRSRKQRERSLRVLAYLDYNRFSRSPEHRELVRALRSGELLSWHGIGEKLIRERDPRALCHLAQRPGYMLRMLSRLLSLGYSEAEIEAVLLPRADAVSAHLLLKVLRTMASRKLTASEKYGSAAASINENFQWELEQTLVEIETVGDADHLREPAELEARRLAALAELEGQYTERLRSMRFDPQASEILKKLLKAHFRLADTPLRAKKLLLRCEQYDLARSSLETGDRSQEGGYLRGGISIRIPEAVRRVRFFVYWNDPDRVDVDLHASARDLTGRHIHIGWDGEYCGSGLVHSGDITHSDAAEYIDIDLNAPLSEVSANIDLFSGKCCFSEIETCYVGMMAVDQLGQDVKLYDPANCFFVHRLTQNEDRLFYGYVDVQNRCLRFIGKPKVSSWTAKSIVEQLESMFSLQDYLDCLFEAQEVRLVESEDEADVVLTMEKGMSDKSVSLVESNFFLEC